MNAEARPRRVSLLLAACVAIAAAVLTVAVSENHSAQAHRDHHHAAAADDMNARELALHDDMRALWEAHIVWTRLAIISFAEGMPDFEATAGRLLQNQVDIGNAIQPYYGAQAGKQLTKLLQEHITGAVDLLTAAKANDRAAFDAASEAWYRNGDEIARFLADANPRNWKFGVVAAMMKGHLDQTLAEAAHRLEGNFEADIHDYEAIHRHILQMADALSSGIIAQFPQRFR